MRSFNVTCKHSGEGQRTVQLLVQMIMAFIKVAWVLCIAGVISITVIKETRLWRDQNPFVLNQQFHICSAVAAGAMLAVLDGFLLASLYRLSVSLRLRQVWTARRQRAYTRSTMRAAVLNVVLVPWFISAALRAASASQFCNPSTFVTLCDLAHWSGWNTLLLLVLIQGHQLVLRKLPDNRDAQVSDLPLWVHWPKLSIWLVCEGAHGSHTASHHPAASCSARWQLNHDMKSALGLSGYINGT